jgi:hypothetical protein
VHGASGPRQKLLWIPGIGRAFCDEPILTSPESDLRARGIAVVARLSLIPTCTRGAGNTDVPSAVQMLGGSRMRPPATIRSAARNGINPAIAALSYVILIGEVISIGLIGLAIVVAAVACSLTYRRSAGKCVTVPLRRRWM